MIAAAPSMAASCRFSAGACRVGRLARPRMVGGEREQRASGRLVRRVRRRHDGLEDLAVALRVDRKAMLEIPGREAALAGVVFQRDLAARQRLAIGLAQHRQQHAAARGGSGSSSQPMSNDAACGDFGPHSSTSSHQALSACRPPCGSARSRGSGRVRPPSAPRSAARSLPRRRAPD